MSRLSIHGYSQTHHLWNSHSNHRPSILENAVFSPSSNYQCGFFQRFFEIIIVLRTERIGLRFHDFWTRCPISKQVDHDHPIKAPALGKISASPNCLIILKCICRRRIQPNKDYQLGIGFICSPHTTQFVTIQLTNTQNGRPLFSFYELKLGGHSSCQKILTHPLLNTLCSTRLCFSRVFQPFCRFTSLRNFCSLLSFT